MTPSPDAPPARPRARALTFLCVLYLAAYVVASSLDLWTTSVALRGGGPDGNPFVNRAGDYVATRAWCITAVAGLALLAYFHFGARNVDRISGGWLEHPMRSFFLGSWLNLFLLAPWSKALRDRAPLHALSFCVAFVLLRLLAATNNLLIIAFGVGPLGSLVGAVGARTSPAVGLLLVCGSLYIALAVGISPWLAARIAEGRRAPVPLSR